MVISIKNCIMIDRTNETAKDGRASRSFLGGAPTKTVPKTAPVAAYRQNLMNDAPMVFAKT